jgi:hypothetical protein
VTRSEYDFGDGVRGKYYRNYLKSMSVVTLDQDVSVRFRTSAAVNQALRTLMQLAGYARVGQGAAGVLPHERGK